MKCNAHDAYAGIKGKSKAKFQQFHQELAMAPRRIFLAWCCAFSFAAAKSSSNNNNNNINNTVSVSKAFFIPGNKTTFYASQWKTYRSVRVRISLNNNSSTMLFVCWLVDGFMSGRCYFFTNNWMQRTYLVFLLLGPA